jgi:hypothetical protein
MMGTAFRGRGMRRLEHGRGHDTRSAAAVNTAHNQPVATT